MLLLDSFPILITDGARGLGASIARILHRHGALVVINYHQSETAAHALVAELGERAWALQADVRDVAQVQAMVAQAQRLAGQPIAGLVNNALADFSFNGDARERLDTIRWEAFDAQLRGALQGALNTLQACLPGLRSRGGSVVNIGTNLFQNPVVPYHDYTASKAALLALTRTAAHEWGPHGIRVNMVSGGLLPTTDASRATPDFVFDLIAGQTPLRKVTTPEAFADAVVFFMSGLSRAVTGQNLVGDGWLVMN
jgi:3-oxoacyl-[acyl-carrier protein] reductase